MNEEQGFHAAMHAEPENTTIPLAYADWLEEQGKPAMADTIRQAIAQGGYRIEGMNAHLRESDAPALFYAHKHPSYKVMMFIRHQDVPGLQFRFTVDHNKEKTPATATADHAQVLHDEGVASGPGATHRYLRQSGIIKDKYGKLQRAGGRQSNTNANVAADSLKPSRTLPVPDVDQPNNFTCGPSAVLSVLKYFNVGPDKLSDVTTALGTTRKASTDPSRIVTYLQQLGLSAVGKQKMSLDDLAEAVQAGSPVIVPLKEYAGDRSHKYGHYVVVIGVDDQHVTVQDSSLDNVLSGSGADAAPGKMLIERAKFNQVWHDKVAGKAYYHYGITVSRPTVARLSRIDETNPYGAAYAASERARTASNNAPTRHIACINAVRGAAAGLWREAAIDHEKARAFHARESVDNFGDKHHLAAEAHREAAIANALAYIASSTGEQDWRPDSITPEDHLMLSRRKTPKWYSSDVAAMLKAIESGEHVPLAILADAIGDAAGPDDPRAVIARKMGEQLPDWQPHEQRQSSTGRTIRTPYQVLRDWSRQTAEHNDRPDVKSDRSGFTLSKAVDPGTFDARIHGPAEQRARVLAAPAFPTFRWCLPRSDAPKNPRSRKHSDYHIFSAKLTVPEARHFATHFNRPDWHEWLDKNFPEQPAKLSRWTQAYPGLHTATFSTPSTQYTALLRHLPAHDKKPVFESTLRHAVSPHGPILHMDFNQRMQGKQTGAYGITGAGHAVQAVRHASGLVKDALHEQKPSVLTFSAAEPSRQRLYDNLTGKVSLIHPEYTGYSLPAKEGKQYALVHKSAEEAFHQAAEKHGVKPTKLNTVKPTSQARLARPVKLAAIPPPGAAGTVTVRVPTPTPVATAVKRPPAPTKPQPTFILPG